MRTNRKAILMAAVMAAGLATQSLRATTLTWDADAAGSLLGGTGTWDTVTALWTPDGVSYVTWSNSNPDSPVFGGTAGTVTLAEPITTNGITLNTTNYVLDLNGNNLTVNGTSAGAGVTNTTFTNTGATRATFSIGTISGTGTKVTGNLNLTLGGSWSPSNVNDFTGTFLFNPTAASTLLTSDPTRVGAATGLVKLDATTAAVTLNFGSPDNSAVGTQLSDPYTRNFEIVHGASNNANITVNGVKEIPITGSIGGGNAAGSGLRYVAAQGNLILAGSNTYAGNTVLTGQSPVLTLANNNALGQSTLVSDTTAGKWTVGFKGNINIGNTARIDLTGDNSFPDSGFGMIHNFDGNNTFAGPVTLGASSQFASTISAEAGSSLTLSGAVGPTATGGQRNGMTKLGPGLLVLTGANTYGQNNIGDTRNATRINDGKLVLDFNQASVSTDIVNNGVADYTTNQCSELSLSGGVLEVKGKTGDTNSQTFKNRGTATANVNPGLTFNPGASALVATQNGANSLTINLGELVAIQRFVGSTVDFTLPTSGSIILPVGNFAGPLGIGTDNTILTANGAAFATVGGSDWAALDASSTRTIVAGSTLSGFYTPNAPDNLSGNADMSSGVDTVLTGSPSITSLRFNDVAARTIDATGQTLSTGGILVTSAVGNNLSKITGGTLTAATGTFNQDLVVIQNNPANALRIESTIVDNGGATGLTKSGPGRLTLTAANTYSGETNLNGGMLKLEGAGTIGSGKLAIHGGVLGLPGGTTFNRPILSTTATTTGANVQFLGSGGFAAYGGNVTVTFGGLSSNEIRFGIQSAGTTDSNFVQGDPLILGASDSDGMVEVTNNIRLGALAPENWEIRVENGSAPVDGKLSGVIRQDGGLTKSGPGVLELSAANTYNGQTIVKDGVLLVTGSIAATSQLTTDGGTLRLGANAIANGYFSSVKSGVIDLNGFTLRVNKLSVGSGSAGTNASITTGAGTLTISGTVTYAGNVNNANGATINGNVAMTANRTFNVGDSTAAANDLTIAANISGSGGAITKTGPGTLKLSGANSYTGNTTINGGTVVAGHVNALSTGAVTVNSGGTLQLQPGLAPFTITTLNLNGTGKLDLTNDTLTTTSTLPTTKSRILAGNIITSSAGLVPGYFDVGSGSIKLRGTVPADANLDGTIDTLDFNALASNFNSSTAVFWQQGDFNGDGTVNALDFNILATDFGQSVPATPAPALGTLVPEPASMGLIALGAIGVMRRRRRGA